MNTEPGAKLEESGGLKRPLPTDDQQTSAEPPAKKQKVENETAASSSAQGPTTTQASSASSSSSVPTTIAPAQPTASTASTSSAPTQHIQENKPKAEDAIRPATDLINSAYTSRARSTQVRDEYKTKTPFNHVVLPDFFNESFLDEIKKGLEQEEWIQKRSDHYTYEVTYDLKGSPHSVIRDMRLALYSDHFRDFLSSITGLALHSDEDLVATLYKQGGHSLCQDPELDTKRICFFLAIGPKNWAKQDGATLDLFALDKNGQPGTPAISVVPQYNSLVFFEVSASTFYQISEVLSNKEMLYLFGYFHGAPLAPGAPYAEASLPTIPLALLPVQFRIQDWVNPEYLKRDVQRKLKLRFEKDSSLALPDFLLKHKYDTIYEALKAETLPWLLIGPFNRRHYSTLGRWGNESESGELLQFKLFCRSKPMVNFVEQITGISVFETHRGEVRRFAHGDYTLVRDNELIYATEGLDVHLGFQDGTWVDDDGGYTTYLDAEDELLTLVPSSNTLSLVSREAGTMRFVKHLSSTAPGPRYDYQNSFVLASKDDDEGEDYADDDDPYVSEDDIEDVDENDDANRGPPPEDDDDGDDDGFDDYS